MSCLNFVPSPARTWSRFENAWIQPGYQPPSMAEQKLTQQLRKARILQYSHNSAPQPKWQRTATIARNQTAGAKRTYATQTASYTNPNSNHLWRVGATRIPVPVGADAGMPTGECVDVANPEAPTMLAGGVLVCGVSADPCTNEPLDAAEVESRLGTVGVQPDGTVRWPPSDLATAVARIQWTPMSASDVPPNWREGEWALPWDRALADVLAPPPRTMDADLASSAGGAAWNSGTANWKVSATSSSSLP